MRISKASAGKHDGKLAKAPSGKLLAKADAQKLETELLSLFRGAERSLLEAAIRLDKFIRGRGWEPLGFETMTQWREARIHFSDFYNLRNAMKLLGAGVPGEQVAKIPLTNLNLIARQLPPSKWTDQKLLKAAEGPIAEFEKVVIEKAEREGTLAEPVLRRGFAGPKSLVDKWDLALKVAEMVDGCEKMEQRIELLVAEYLNGCSESKDKSRLQIYEEMRANHATIEP